MHRLFMDSYLKVEKTIQLCDLTANFSKENSNLGKEHAQTPSGCSFQS